MYSNHHSSVDLNNGNVSWEGDLSIEKGDHSHMPGVQTHICLEMREVMSMLLLWVELTPLIT